MQIMYLQVFRKGAFMATPAAIAVSATAVDAVNDETAAPSPARSLGTREFILRGAIVPTLLRLGLPTLIVIMVQTLVGVIETYFVSLLGTDALAGAAVVFPVLMLMQMMANGGFGGGVASAVSRAIGG